MKIDEVLAQTDELQPNQYDDAIKISWLSKLDQKIYEELIQNYEKDADTPSEFHGYSVNDVSASLLADDAFADMYVDYLFAMMNYINQESERYVNSMNMFEEKYKQYTAWYNRTHRHIRRNYSL